MKTIGNSCLGICEKDMLDKSIVKLFNGIAGSAKSSSIEKFMSEYGIKYARFTSTNKLKRDAIDRFGGYVETIAGGMFTTSDGIFYDEQKNVPYETIVIDEILQTSPRVFQWIQSNVGKNNIIVCTDDRQMLSPGQGERMKEEFDKFRKLDFVLEMELDHTFRPRDGTTVDYYNMAYESVETNKNLYYLFVKKK